MTQVLEGSKGTAKLKNWLFEMEQVIKSYNQEAYNREFEKLTEGIESRKLNIVYRIKQKLKSKHQGEIGIDFVEEYVKKSKNKEIEGLGWNQATRVEVFRGLLDRVAKIDSLASELNDKSEEGILKVEIRNLGLSVEKLQEQIMYRDEEIMNQKERIMNLDEEIMNQKRKLVKDFFLQYSLSYYLAIVILFLMEHYIPKIPPNGYFTFGPLYIEQLTKYSWLGYVMIVGIWLIDGRSVLKHIFEKGFFKIGNTKKKINY